MNLNCLKVVEGPASKCSACGKLAILVENSEPTDTMPPSHERFWWCRCGHITQSIRRVLPAPTMPLPILTAWGQANGEKI